MHNLLIKERKQAHREQIYGCQRWGGTGEMVEGVKGYKLAIAKMSWDTMYNVATVVNNPVLHV